jgi:RimJ/RimL family protein N-acetyltransferase
MRGGTTARLTIEPLREDHAEALYSALSDERVGTYLGGPDVESLEWLRDRITRLLAGAPPGSGQEWWNGVVLLDGAVIGRVEATLHDGDAEVAYVLGPQWWRQGYGTEATTWLLDELRAAGVRRAWATVMRGNAGSRGVLRRAGFVEVEPPEAPVLLSYDDGDLVLVKELG